MKSGHSMATTQSRQHGGGLEHGRIATAVSARAGGGWPGQPLGPDNPGCKKDDAMDYRSRVQVSPLCLGAMMFGGATDEPAAARIIDRARDGGVNLLDTADVYTGGESERITSSPSPGC